MWQYRVHGYFLSEEESFSHANTTCAGKNCVVLSYSNHVIDAFGFYLSLGTSISIATVATVAVDLMGQEIVLVIHAALYFGDLIHHSLPSVNQVRSYEVPLWDNPCDPYHKLSIEASARR